MPENAVLLQRPGPVSLERQVAACIPHLDDNDYILVGKAQSHADALALVLNGAARVVVTARPAEDDWRLERLLAEVEGRLEVCRASRPHKPPETGHGHDTSEIVVRMADRGATEDQIVEFLGVSLERVRRVLGPDG
jgi:hypothetical protein